eukprot:85124-Pelagomonas_calceolata.AAC.2
MSAFCQSGMMGMITPTITQQGMPDTVTLASDLTHVYQVGMMSAMFPCVPQHLHQMPRDVNCSFVQCQQGSTGHAAQNPEAVQRIYQSG